MIRDLREEAGMKLNEAAEAIDSYLYLLSKKKIKKMMVCIDILHLAK